jgi:hypothetical protein
MADQPDSFAPVVHPKILYFYKIRWGFQQEYFKLFAKNHYKILQEQIRTGRLLEVKTHSTRFNGDGRADCQMVVEITYRDWMALSERTERSIARRLFPDQATYDAEEQRRFSLLEAHWDITLQDLVLE